MMGLQQKNWSFHTIALIILIQRNKIKTYQKHIEKVGRIEYLK